MPQHNAHATPDLVELRPNLFLIHNPLARKLLKSEGDIRGNRFVLTGWRREGLLARLRQQGFGVSTLDDQIDALPPLPRPVPTGAAHPRPLSGKERYSFFNPAALAWVPVEPPATATRTLLLHEGWIVRRRHGRGPASYARVVADHEGRAGLIALDETAALLQGYAQATLIPRAPLPVVIDQEHVWLPDLPLPLPYRDMLKQIGHYQKQPGWQVETHGVPPARRLYARLGLALAEPARTPADS